MRRRLALLALAFAPLSLAVPATQPAGTARPEAVRLFDPKSPADSLAVLHVKDGYEVELVASEPLIESPVAIDWGPDGRLWVAEMIDYPTGMDGNGSPGGRIKVLTDSTGSGKYDTVTTFMDKVHMPNGVKWWKHGVLVTAAPDIFFTDTNADGSAAAPQTLYTGFGERNPQLRVNALRWGFDGWLYCANGLSNGSPKSLMTGTTLDLTNRDCRLHVDDGQIEVLSGPSQYGRDRDEAGNWFGVHNSFPLFHYVLEDRYLRRNKDVATPDPKRQMVLPSNAPLFARSAAKELMDRTQASPGHPGHFTSACGMSVYKDELLFGRDGAVHAFSCEPVHNLVRHTVLTDEGISFASRIDEPGKEFLASEDPWCRMVQTRTGPDGALWVVDMYRYMVEHPAYLPEGGKERMAKFFREGINLGRIYRVYPKGKRPGAVPRMDRMDTPALVAELESANGWRRDTAQQLLLEKRDPAAVAALSAMASGGRTAVGRLTALWTLRELKALDGSLVERALKDESAAVRRQAVVLAEGMGTPELVKAALALAGDGDAKVRLQVALSAGEWSTPEAGAALAKLAVEPSDDPQWAAAIMSSATHHYAAIADAVLNAKRSPLDPIYRDLLDMAVARIDRQTLERLLKPIVLGEPTPERVTALSRFAELVALRKASTSMYSEGNDELSMLMRKLSPLIDAARRMAVDERAAVAQRAAAVTLLGHVEGAAEHISVFTGLLTPQTPPNVQVAAVRAIARTARDKTPALLLEHWASYPPTTRGVVMDVLLGNEPWAFEFLSQIDQGKIPARQLDPVRRQRVQKITSERVKTLAAKVIGSAAGDAAARQKVVDQHMPALSLAGDPARGAKVFAQNCATCHHIGDVGNEIGPDLRSVGGWTGDALLTAILDPNRQVEPRYYSYNAVTNAGEQLFGIITAETEASITLKGLDAKEMTLPRSTLKSLEGTNKSLMPDGLEGALSDQDLADVIRFLQTLN